MKNVHRGLSLFCLSLFFLTGCATQQPKQYKFEKSFVITIDKAEALSRVKTWLLERGFIITENTPTLITANIVSLDELQGYSYDAWKGIKHSNPLVDCGYNAHGTDGAQVSISIDSDRVDSRSGAKVYVNFVPLVKKGVARQCVSNGEFEGAIKTLLTQ